MSGGWTARSPRWFWKRDGYDVTGAYMKNWINEDGVVGDCSWMEDIEDARRVSEQIGIPFQVTSCRTTGRRSSSICLRATPRGLPRIRRHVQPRDQVRGLPDLGRGARLRHGRHRPLSSSPSWAEDGTVELVEGADRNKDQTYFLALLNQG